MAHVSGSFHSQSLDMKTHFTVVFPKDVLAFQNPKVVYLLHGLSDNHTDWFKQAQLSLLAEDYNLIFILPEVQRGFYTDMAYGMQYFTYISEELPAVCKKLFRIPDKREDTYVMGLSMGGYGALKCALKLPGQYAGCGAFSSAVDLNDLITFSEEQADSELRVREMKAVFGMEYELIPENDLFRLAEACNQQAQKPRIFMTCGTNDFLHDANLRFRNHMQAMDFDYTYEEWEGVHEWYFWNKSLHLSCAHFFPRVREENYCNVK